MAKNEVTNVTPTDANDEGDTDASVEGRASDALEGLLEKLCLGELDPAGWRWMSELLRGDRDAARRYVEVAHYCETLRDETNGAVASNPMSAEPSASVPGNYPPASTSASATSIGRADRHNDGRSGWLLAQMLPWGLAVGLAFFAGWVVSWPADRAPETQRAAFARSLPALSEPGKSEPLGRVTGLTPVASSDGLLRSLKVGAPLGRGEVFQLTRGSARLEIDGGEVLVEGPAEISAIDTNTVFLRRGSVMVRHPGRMTIQTPLAVATGNGAAFAVVARSDSEAIVTVLEGSVSADAAPDRTLCREPSDCALAAGETVLFERTDEATVASRSIETPPEGLLTAWDQTSESLHDYERLVLEDNPIAYWPLYRVRRHRPVLDLTQNGFDGYAIGNWPTELSDVHASQPRGAYFDGESYVESDRKPSIDLRSGFTMESWARVAGGPEFQAVFTSRWVRESNTDREQCFGYTLYAGSNDKWQVWTGSGEYGKNWDQLHSDAPVERNRWTHVAAAFEPDANQQDATESLVGWVRVYVDGDQVAEARHTLSLEDFEWPARIGAAEFVPQSLTSWLFQGELRDVAIYDHVLEPNRIERHAEQGRSAT